MSKCPFVDLSDPDLHRGGVPADLYRDLREARVLRVEHPMKGGEGFWAFFRQADVDRISKNPALFSSALKGSFLNDMPEDQLPVFGIDSQGSRAGRAAPPCRNSIEMPSGERTKAMRPSRGGRLIVTPAACSRSHSA